MLFQAAHIPHILLVVQSVDDASRTQEETSFEKGVREEVKDTCIIGAHAHRDEHETQLGDRRIG